MKEVAGQVERRVEQEVEKPKQLRPEHFPFALISTNADVARQRSSAKQRAWPTTTTAVERFLTVQTLPAGHWTASRWTSSGTINNFKLATALAAVSPGAGWGTKTGSASFRRKTLQF
ncbi:MAG: hypothetical protein IPH53_12685 [Flavobacteriales bacterium]|nr:hypothetical protein [Flavobacteriales bacterium]